jgi:hypothetical protein
MDRERGQELTEAQEARSGRIRRDGQDAGDLAPGAAGPGVVREIGGPKGPEPTRYGDWERAGRCVDF